MVPTEINWYGIAHVRVDIIAGQKMNIIPTKEGFGLSGLRLLYNVYGSLRHGKRVGENYKDTFRSFNVSVCGASQSQSIWDDEQL